MKLIIEIPEEFFKTIQENKYGVHNGRIYEMIRNGTPLEEPKTEKWLVTEYNFENYVKCSNCGILKKSRTKYCPDCGAKMGGKYGNSKGKANNND